MEKWPYHYHLIITGSFLIIVAGVLFSVLQKNYFSVKQLDIGFAQEMVWTGAAGDGLWDSPENWSTRTIPTALDTVSIDNATVTVSGSSTISFNTLYIGKGGVTNVILEGSILKGMTIELGQSGSLIQKNNREQILSDSLIVKNGGVLTHAPNMTSPEFGVRFAARTITVNAGGAVKVDRLGFAPGNSGPGAGGSSRDGAGGGGNGGKGGDGVGAEGGAAYCAPDRDVQMGSGGGNGSLESSGAGGGLVVLRAFETMTINGKVTAAGYAGTLDNAGGGAGGGIMLIARTVAGMPEEIRANGGSGNKNGGGGGGGCVVVKFVGSNSLSESAIDVLGGSVDFENLPPSSSQKSGVTATTTDNSAQSATEKNIPQKDLENSLATNTSSSVTDEQKLDQPEQKDKIEKSEASLLTEILPSVSSTILSVAESRFQENDNKIAKKGEDGKVFVQHITPDQLPIIPTSIQKVSSTILERVSTSSLDIPTASTTLLATTTERLLQSENQDQSIAFLTLPKKSDFIPGEVMSLVFSVMNQQTMSLRFKVSRQILDEKNKILVSKENSVALKPQQSFVYEVSQRIPSSLKAGIYTFKIILFDQKENVLKTNSFRFQVK